MPARVVTQPPIGGKLALYFWIKNNQLAWKIRAGYFFDFLFMTLIKAMINNPKVNININASKTDMESPPPIGYHYPPFGSKPQRQKNLYRPYALCLLVL